jgi:hypothetical protein
MATRQDFTDDEWTSIQRGLTGSGMLVSLSDRDLSDSFGEAGAISKYLAGQQVAGPTPLMREIAKTKGTGFGLTASPDKVRDGTIQALRAAITYLTAKAPDEVEAYRALVLGIAAAAAEAKGGVSEIETQATQLIRDALGG